MLPLVICFQALTCLSVPVTLVILNPYDSSTKWPLIEPMLANDVVILSPFQINSFDTNYNAGYK